MRKLSPILAVLPLVAGLALPGTARASEDLAKKHNCTACHAVEKKMIGPAYVDVAKKYKGQADAANVVAGRIAKGSTGNWGAIPMPPNAAVPAADVQALAAWVVGLAK